MSRILIAGGSGLIGSRLTKVLSSKGHDVFVLSRNRQNIEGATSYLWDIEKQTIEDGALEGVDFIVNLTGANIAEKRWTAERKKLILSSRVDSIRLLFNVVSKRSEKPKAFISASATGYYGAVTSDKIFSETDQPANDFLGNTCRLWEAEADQFEKIGIRTVKLRTAVVISKEFLSRLLFPFKLGMGAAFASGKQYFPWIHLDDCCDCYVKAIEDPMMQGAYNIVAPEYLNNIEFTKTLAVVLKRPYWLPNIPSTALTLALGEMAQVLTEGSRMSADKILKTGFQFKHESLFEALQGFVT